jgi:hypothetical protein
MNVYDANGLARILLTITTIGFSIVPMFADLNKTHATNPLWTPHARFHVVWQVLSYGGIGIISMMLLWRDGGDYLTQLYLVLGMCASVYAAFFTTYFAMPMFGGKAYDENGYLPIPINLGGLKIDIDLNFTVFGTFVVILVIAFLSITPA